MSTSQPATADGFSHASLQLEDLPPTLSVEQAAQLIGIGRNAAYRAAHSGDIPAFRVGRKLRVPTAGLLRLLELERELAASSQEE